MQILHLLRLPSLPTGILLRGALSWLIVRIGTAIAQVGLGTPAVGLGVVGIAATIVLIDARRRREHLFLANLGVSQTPVWALAALAALVSEAVLRAVA